MKSAAHPTAQISTRRIAARRLVVLPVSVRPSRLAWAGIALAALSGALVLPLMPSAQAATAIERCIAEDGTPIYTDQPCAVIGAQRAPISAELLSRIAREQAATGSPDQIQDRADGPLRPAAAAIARRSAASGCARSPTQLSMDVQGAWALGDVNRIAESYHWAGMSQSKGQQIMQQLDRLAGQPVLQAEYFDARIGSGGMQLAGPGGAGGGAAGILQVRFAGSTSASVQDFHVEQYRGCYFIRF